MRKKPLRRVAPAIAIVIAFLAMAAGSAAAQTKYTGTIVPPSSITIAGKTFPLGTPQSPPPPADCGIPLPWEPSQIDFEVDDSPDPLPHLVDVEFEFEPGAADLPFLGWKRVLISGSGSGTIDPSTGEVSVAVTAYVDFEDCDGGNYSHECTGSATIPLTGDIDSYPVVTGSTAEVSGSGSLSAPCGGAYFFLNLASVSVDLEIDF